MFENIDNIYGIELFKIAISKFGKEFESIFAIMPEETVRKYLKMDFLQARKELIRNFSDFTINK